MSGNMSRREALATGAAASGLFACASCGNPQKRAEKAAPGESWWQESEWSRGPDRDLVRDLTPGPTPVRLACSSSATRLWYPEDKSITEAVKSIRDQGYTAAGVSHPPGRHNKWIDATDSEVTELKAALQKYDVIFFDMMTWDNRLVFPDRALREKSIRHITDNLEAAERCGALSVCVPLGTCEPEFGRNMHPDNWTMETWKRGVDSVKQILRNTSGFNAVVALEAVITHPIDGPRALKKFMEDVGDSHCKVALDPANMFTIANYYHSTEMINLCFDILGEDIVCCHAKDTLIEPNEMLVLMTMKPAGKGIQDYETYLARMSHMKYPRVLMLEFAKPEEYPAAKAFVEETAAKVGVGIYS